MEHNVILIYVPCPTTDTARTIAQTVIQERLAACANILQSVQSLYMWEGQMQQEEETVCLLKTQKTLFPALQKRIEELHPYETPCIISIPVTMGNTPFMQWVVKETTRQ